MKIKEEMIEEFKKYLEEFDNYDKELEDIENKNGEKTYSHQISQSKKKKKKS